MRICRDKALKYLRKGCKKLRSLTMLYCKGVSKYVPVSLSLSFFLWLNSAWCLLFFYVKIFIKMTEQEAKTATKWWKKSMHTCMYACSQACTFTCIHAHDTHTCACMPTCTHTHTDTHTEKWLNEKQKNNKKQKDGKKQHEHIYVCMLTSMRIHLHSRTWHTYTCMHAYVHTHTYRHTHTQKEENNTGTCMHACSQTCTFTCLRVHDTHICVYARTHPHTHMHAHTYTHTYIYTNIYSYIYCFTDIFPGMQPRRSPVMWRQLNTTMMMCLVTMATEYCTTLCREFCCSS